MEELRQGLPAGTKKYRSDSNIATSGLQAAWQKAVRKLLYPHEQSIAQSLGERN